MKETIFSYSIEELEDISIDYIEQKYKVSISHDYAAYTKTLTDWWYTSGLTNLDFKFYADPHYITVQLECFKMWTQQRAQQTIDYIKQHTELELKSLIDFGAGSGFSTLMFAEAFPDATIFYIDLSKSPSWEAFHHLLDITKVTNINCYEVPPQDWKAQVVCGFDIFEHFQKPMPIIRSLLGNNNHFYFDSSSFHYEAPGHFPSYWIDELYIGGRRVKQEFTRSIEELGYVTSKSVNHIVFPNNRPLVFINESSLSLLKYEEEKC